MKRFLALVALLSSTMVSASQRGPEISKVRMNRAAEAQYFTLEKKSCVTQAVESTRDASLAMLKKNGIEDPATVVITDIRSPRKGDFLVQVDYSEFPDFVSTITYASVVKPDEEGTCKIEVEAHKVVSGGASVHN